MQHSYCQLLVPHNLPGGLPQALLQQNLFVDFSTALAYFPDIAFTLSSLSSKAHLIGAHSSVQILFMSEILSCLFASHSTSLRWLRVQCLHSLMSNHTGKSIESFILVSSAVISTLEKGTNHHLCYWTSTTCEPQYMYTNMRAAKILMS